MQSRFQSWFLLAEQSAGYHMTSCLLIGHTRLETVPIEGLLCCYQLRHGRYQCQNNEKGIVGNQVKTLVVDMIGALSC